MPREVDNVTQDNLAPEHVFELLDEGEAEFGNHIFMVNDECIREIYPGIMRIVDGIHSVKQEVSLYETNEGGK